MQLLAAFTPQARRRPPCLPFLAGWWTPAVAVPDTTRRPPRGLTSESCRMRSPACGTRRPGLRVRAARGPTRRGSTTSWVRPTVAGPGRRTRCRAPRASELRGREDCRRLVLLARGGTSAATVWDTSTPGQGGWRQVFPGNIGIDMTTASPGVCVSVTTVGVEVETPQGTAWSTADIGAVAGRAAAVAGLPRLRTWSAPRRPRARRGDRACVPRGLPGGPDALDPSAAVAAERGRKSCPSPRLGLLLQHQVRGVPHDLALCRVTGSRPWIVRRHQPVVQLLGHRRHPRARSATAGVEWSPGRGQPLRTRPARLLVTATVCLSWDGARTMV